MNELIKAVSLTKSFKIEDYEIKALDNVNLTIYGGEVLMIMGPSGAGKSTLLHLLGLMDTPTGGSLSIENNDVSAMNDSQRAKLRNKLIGFIFQFHYLLPEFNALENVIIPGLIEGKNRKDISEKGMNLLSGANLSHRSNHFPAQLSGGEQQRAALARALFNNPKLLLADEPTGNLDHESGEAVMDILRRSVKEWNMTLVIVTHNQDLTKYADRIIMLKEGRISS